jgi:ABC-2 type transport system ATP-binding protein
MPTCAIRTEQLTRDFATVRAVDKLTLEVPAGSLFGFLGPNGAGKTTVIRLLLGLLEPSDGRAEVLGFDPRTHGQEVRTRAGALLEHSGLYERLSALENLEFYGRVARLPAAERSARIHLLLEHLGLWERRADLVGTWSRGMKQKLAVARALLHRPPLLFLDEPTAGLDAVSAASLRDDLQSLVRQDGLTVFLTTHNLSEAERLCTQVAVIRRGALLAVGAPDELRARSGGPRAEFVGQNFSEAAVAELRHRPEVAAVVAQPGRLSVELLGEAPVAPLLALLVAGGAQVEEVQRGKATLEEAFLDLLEEPA